MKTSAICRPVALSLGVALLGTALVSAPASAEPTTQAAKLVASSKDGAAFDLDENADGDIIVQVTDAADQPIDVDDAQDLTYSWSIKSFGANPTTVRVPVVDFETVTTDDAGAFAVPLPDGHGAGTYVLSAGLSADSSSAHAISSAVRLTVKAGQAELSLTDASPLRPTVGTEHAVAGALRLEDGTPLPGRRIDVELSRGTSGTDPEPDAGFVHAAPDTELVRSIQVTTAANGTFSTVLRDPAEDGQGTELGGVLDIFTATTPDVGNADAQADLAVDFVSRTAPAGSTTSLTDLGEAVPGKPIAGTLTVVAPDGTFDSDADEPGVQGDGNPDLVVGQVVTLTVDRGFFTTGNDKAPYVVGAPAGNLEQNGTTLTGLTDQAGQLDFNIGIARDKGFDDDGRVTATVKASVGALSTSGKATWDSSEPLNGRVSLKLAPPSEQENPVNPAVSGDRVYYDVFTLDQFGNRVGDKTVELAYAGDLDNWDYSDESMPSDFDTFGDIWLKSDEPGSIKITGTWENAPTLLYTDTDGSTDPGTADATNSTTASFYDVRFGSSKFSITSTAKDVVRVGSSVSQTVRVTDQLGRPVQGYEVQFYRFGPDKVRGDALSTRLTNVRGEATYTYVGSKLGRGKVTAEISDGIHIRRLRTTATFGTAIKARLTKGKGGAGADRLTVTTNPIAKGAKAYVYRVVKGKRTRVGVERIDALGTAQFKIRDRNKTSKTTYVAVVKSTAKTVADQTNTVKIR